MAAARGRGAADLGDSARSLAGMEELARRGGRLRGKERTAGRQIYSQVRASYKGAGDMASAARVRAAGLAVGVGSSLPGNPPSFSFV